MRNLLIVFAASVILAYLSQYRGYNYMRKAGEKKRINGYIVLMIILMIMIVGLRTGYNDTGAYVRGFENSVGIREFFADSENFHPLHNPLFYAIQAFFKSFNLSIHAFFMFWAIIDIILLVNYILTYTDGEDFAFSIFIFFALGTFTFGMGALKQITGMAILTLAVPYLERKQWVRYLLIVFIASQIHTYALLFLILPFFRTRPWNQKSILLMLGTVLVMRTFNGTVMSVLSYADSIGKSVSVDEVLDGNAMSILRVAVFALTPIAIFVYRHRLLPQMRLPQELFTNMSIIGLMFMLLATQNGANMFGRIATYFELGIAMTLPWVLRKLFNRPSYKIMTIVCMVCFMGFFLYDNQGFDATYTSINMFEYLRSL